MLNALRGAGLLVPTVFAIPALAILIGLGSWQWQRKAWKEGLIEQLAKSAKAEPKDISELELRGSVDTMRFQRVRIAGKFAGAGESLREFHVWTPDAAGPGWRIVSPFRLRQPIQYGGIERAWVLVIRGRVAQADKSAEARPTDQIAGSKEVVGRLRLAETNWATPAPNLQANEWYALDLDGMLEALRARDGQNGSVIETSSKALPFFVEAENALAPPPAPQPELKSIHLSNRHLEYAMTWWGLAATLIAVYIAFVRARLSAREATG